MQETYTVKPGDTLYGISNQFGVSVRELSNLNNVIPENLQVGQVLIIPSNIGTNPSNIFMYTVKSGDSLYSIARVYNTTVSEIKSLNNLKSDKLSIGQVLMIPEEYTKESEMVLPEYINYTVKKGDTIYSIARKYGISASQIISDNSLNSNYLSIGQNLRIRTMNNQIIEECIGEDYIPPNSGNTTNYTVKKGDSLYKIANMYNTSVSEIINLNNLKSDNLYIGQVLTVPTDSSNTESIVYIVKSGDSLYSIARTYNTTVDSIKRKNNLSSNNLSIGQKLII